MPRKTKGYRNVDLIWPERQWSRVKAASRLAGMEVWRFIFGATMKRVEEVERSAASPPEEGDQSTTPLGSTL